MPAGSRSSSRPGVVVGREADNGQHADSGRRNSRPPGQAAGRRAWRAPGLGSAFRAPDAMPFSSTRRNADRSASRCRRANPQDGEAVEQRQHAIGAVGEGAQDLVRVDAQALAAFVKPGLGARRLLIQRKKQECEEIARYTKCAPASSKSALRSASTRPSTGSGRCCRMDAGEASCRCLRQSCSSPGRGKRKALLMRLATATSSAATERSRSGPRKPSRALERTISNTCRVRPGRPRADRRRASGGAAIFQANSSRPPSSHREESRNAQMPAPDLGEERIATGRPDGHEMTDRPDGEADEPEAQAETHSPGQRAVHDRDGTRRTAKQDVFGQGAFGPAPKSQARRRAVRGRPPSDGRSAAEAEEAEEERAGRERDRRSDTIWIRRRKPPLVSPKASARPVAMMITHDLATGPSDRLEYLLKRLLPRHGGAGGMGRRGRQQPIDGEKRGRAWRAACGC